MVRTVSIHWDDRQKAGWYEQSWPHEPDADFDGVIDRYDSITRWITACVENAQRHARWTITADHMSFRFRYERDYLNFLIRWR